MKQLLIWFMKTKLYKALLSSVVPYIRFTLYYPKIDGRQYLDGYQRLKPGHIILAVDKRKLTTVLIGGEFSHAAFCVSKGPGYEVAEMTHTNYTKSYFFDVCKEADRVVILECLDFDQDYVKLIVEKCKTFEKALYDVEFTLGVEALYCSELVFQSDFERRLKVNLEDLAGLGRPYISPTGLYKAANVSVVWDSDKT